MKPNALSAFIGVYRRLKILLPGLSYHPALTALRSHRTTTGKDDTDTKMYSLACHLGWGTSVKETDYEREAVKKRWPSVFCRVEEVRPELFADSDAGDDNKRQKAG